MNRFIAFCFAASVTVAPSFAADDFDTFIVDAVTPKAAGWTLRGDDPTGIGALGVKRFEWIAREGKDRMLLFVDQGNTLAPKYSRASDVSAGGRNCKSFTSKTEFGSEDGPFLVWASECTLKGGDIMTLKHFAYVNGKTGYKASRIWRERPSEEALSEWNQTITVIVSRINEENRD